MAIDAAGVATALKILFSSSDCSGELPAEHQPFAHLHLERNEVIALVNLLERFAASITYYQRLSSQLAERQGLQRAVGTTEAVY